MLRVGSPRLSASEVVSGQPWGEGRDLAGEKPHGFVYLPFHFSFRLWPSLSVDNL